MTCLVCTCQVMKARVLMVLAGAVAAGLQRLAVPKSGYAKLTVK